MEVASPGLIIKSLRSCLGAKKDLDFVALGKLVVGKVHNVELVQQTVSTGLNK